ncbi:MAG: ABC transporter permease [Planctomycetota bacterium]|jgi:putative ABC transport system permease protein|nr:MAG: ABC transporter permease [Planctomycetota bacterium]RLS92423.1 MAG: ABC transporter permease [Planctomycetota bacterium]
MTDFTIVLRSLRVRLFSTIVTALLVATSAGLLLTILSLRSAGKAAFERGSGNAHLLVSADQSPLVAVLNGLFYANPPRAPLSQAKVSEIRRLFPWDFMVETQLGDSYRGFPVLATTPEFFTKFEPVVGEPWAPASGKFFDGNMQVVLGAACARETGLRMGAKLVLTHGSGASREGGEGEEHGHVHREYEFEVVGILKPTGSPHDRALFVSLESSWILHAHDRREREGLEGKVTAADLLEDDRKVTGMLLRLPTRSGSNVSSALQQVFDTLRRDTSITVAQPADQIDKLFNIVANVDGIFIALAIVTLFSSAVAILLSMVNSMAQRRRQIAVLRVLGASQSRVFGIVLTEAAVIGLLGSVAGILVSVIALTIATAWLRESLGLIIAPDFDPRASVIVAAGAVALSALAGLVPAVMAYRTSVSTQLRPLG